MRKLVYLWTWPIDIVVWGVACLVALIGCGRLVWQDGGAWAVIADRGRWRGITLGHGGVLTEAAYGTRQDRTRTERHEAGHVEQFEAIVLAGFALGTVVAAASLWCEGGGQVALVGGLIPWLLAWPAVVGAAHLVAWVRGEPIYRGAFHEEAARAAEQEDVE